MMINNRRVVLVGCGNHARDFYLPLLRELGAQLTLVVDLASRESLVRQELAVHGFAPEPELFLVDDGCRDAEELPAAQAGELWERLRVLGVTTAIVSTEPKAHKSYAKFFLRNEIDVMVDKPLTAPVNASTDLAQAEQVYADYEELLKLSERHPKVRFTIHCQRRYDPAFRYIKNLLDKAVLEYQVPVTHIDVYHGNGHWNMPPEFVAREDHPHKYGYGKLLHSGYHYVDLFAWFSSSNDRLSDRAPDRVRLIQQTQRPEDLLFQIRPSEHQQFFGPEVFQEFFASHTPGDFDGYGETESCSVIHLLRGDRVVTSGTIRLVDTTVSRRAWEHTPANVNIGNGRIRHSQLNVNVGPLLTVQLHSYESYERRNRADFPDDPAEPGNWDHEDVYVFRNSGVIGGEPFERIRGRDLADEFGYGTDDNRCTLERGQRQMLHEFLAGKPPATPLQDYGRTCRLLALLLQASAKERQHEPPLVESTYEAPRSD
jgi:predicted dehydrogenase